MSALFDDAERFDSLIVVGDTVRRVKDATEEHVGPGAYSPSMAKSKDFGHIGVSTSRRSNMDPPLSPRSTEHQRHATGSVVRDGVWFHPSPFLAAGPGPGAYSPSIISSDHERGRTAKPSSGAVGRQAWDLRGSAGGTPLSNFRNGFSVSSSMGTTPRMVDFAQVALRDGVLLLRSANDGHRSNGIGPGEYHGVSNGQDPMTKRSYNMRAQSSQIRRERSLSFSGTSSTAKAFLSLASSMARTAPTRSNKEAASCRPDLHLLGRNTYPAPGGVGGRGGDGRSTSPGKERRTDTGSRSLSPKANRGRSGFAIRGAAGGRYGRGDGIGGVGHGPATFHPISQQQQQQQQQQGRGRQARTTSSGASRECRSLSPRGRDSGGRPVGGGRASPPLRAEHGSSRRKNATSVSISAPSSPRNSRRSTAKKYASTTGGITGAVGGGNGGSNGSDASYTFDYFGLAGQRGVWRGLEAVSAARAEVGIEATKDNDDGHNSNKQASATGSRGGNEAQSAAGETESESGRGRGAGGGGARGRRGEPGSLLPERVPAKGVCSPPKETRDDLHTYYAAVNRTTAALDSTSGSNLPPPPSPRALR
ncbi:hypothetical protein Esi_0110_0069 [Ectocarpus siliculosus]|uniref:Uncharacterized protein n=1 Tax=Ectocarpus siliculosus TaxID=2880 RepID=D7FHS7_ECTSI|nr:hypothetical protein Esi_0110_0069 [Ectocarpus siliculosus]|eukprot:CBJ28632.1 hypothetical protein Esi_0110_0069 [Ectocarpus siliculosus]